nr:reverse transcriptase domain-containing protein [Tanacetum cinerariifolium]
MPEGKGRRDGGVLNRLGDKGKSVFADSESRYQSYRPERTESILKKRHHERTCSRRTKMLFENPFTSRIWYFDLPKKTRMPKNVKTYDRSDDPEDHLKIFQAAAKVERWAMPSWCHMSNSTLTGSARVWFDDLPLESIDSYDDLKKVFLVNFLQQKKCIKDPVEIHHIKQREGEFIKDFMQIFKAESRPSKCMRISGFMHEITNPELIKRLHDNLPKSVDEMMRVTTTFLRGEVTASNQARKKTLPAWKHGENKILTEGEISEISRDQSGDVTRQKITQSFSPNPEIAFPPLGDEDGAEGLMIIEAEIGGHFTYRIYVDGGSALEILYEHCFNRIRPEVKNQMVSATAPLIGFRKSRVRKIQAVPSTAHGMLKFPVPGGILTLRSSRIIPLECTMVSGPKAQASDVIQATEERIKVSIHPEYPEQTIAIGSTLTKEGRKALCDLLRCNLDIFAWKPADMTGVLRDIAKHIRNVHAYKGYHQMKMAKEDEEKTTFITSQGIFCYSKMPFGLKNTRVTYQRLTDKAFQKQIGINLERKACSWVTRTGNTNRTNRKRRTDCVTCGGARSRKCGVNDEKGGKANASLLCQSYARTLQGPEINYTSMKKLVLALVHASKRLKRYFQAHAIIVITDQPIKHVLSKPEITGRMQKWSIKLGEYDIQYRPRTSVKGQILADFIVERPKEDSMVTTTKVEEEPPELWTLFTDGSSCVDGFGAGLILTSPKGTKLIYALRFRFDATNNEAKYEALMVEGPGKVKFLIVAINYFTKWIEAKPITIITGNQIKKFIWDNIVCRFGLPREIISDNEKQLKDNTFKYWCEKLCIRQHFASVKHPQANGLVERANKSLGEGIKAHLDKKSKDWIEEILHVLWAHCTMIKSSNGDTPFSLIYGIKAVIPAKIGMPTLRTSKIDMVQNDEALEIKLDILKERKEQAAIREARSKAKMEKYYNSKVHNTSFKLGDLVYKNNDASHAKDSGKLSPKWKGPYEVTEALGNGAYKLRDRNGKLISRTWNVRNLKIFYIHEM